MTGPEREAYRSARRRIIRYLNCAQASLSAVTDSRGATKDGVVKAACPLEGGALSMGSTCGVVSGGCLALAQLLRGEEADAACGEEELYGRLREYTAWFEGEFGSTLCRERSGVEFSSVRGFVDYLLTGKVYTRCVTHIGRAAVRLLEIAERSPGERKGGGDTTGPAGYCATDVLEGIMEDTGFGGDTLERIAFALDGGVGLSGGLCGALAGALLPVGLALGIEPRTAGVLGTLIPSIRGHIDMYTDRVGPGLWSSGSGLVGAFGSEFGSLECREITGRSFESVEDLAGFVPASDVCGGIKNWCRVKAADLLARTA